MPLIPDPITPSSAPELPPALLVAARDAAALCAVSVATWWRWHAAARCPAPVRVGATVRWRRDELADWIGCGCPDRQTWVARSRAGGGR